MPLRTSSCFAVEKTRKIITILNISYVAVMISSLGSTFSIAINLQSSSFFS